MAFIPVLNTVEVAIKQTIDDEDMVNTLYFHRPSAWDSTELASLAAIIEARVIELWPAFHHPGCRYIGLYLRDLTTDSGLILDFPVETPLAGSLGGAHMTNNAAWAIKFSTGFAGRSFRGRNFSGGIANNGLENDNHVNTTYMGFVRDFYEAIQADALADGSTMVVVSRYTGGAARAAGVYTPVTTISGSDNVVDSMRRRLPRRGS